MKVVHNLVLPIFKCRVAREYKEKASSFPTWLMFLNIKDINLTNDPLNGYVKYNLNYLQHAKERNIIHYCQAH